MYEQPRYEPLEPSSFFEDGKSSRPLVAGTVPREDARGALPKGADEDVFYSGWDKGRLAEMVPFPVDRALCSSAARSGTGSTASRAMPSRATAAA